MDKHVEVSNFQQFIAYLFYICIIAIVVFHILAPLIDDEDVVEFRQHQITDNVLWSWKAIGYDLIDFIISNVLEYKSFEVMFVLFLENCFFLASV